MLTSERAVENGLDEMFQGERGLINKWEDCKTYGICNSTTKKQKKRKKTKINAVNKKDVQAIASLSRTGIDHEFTGIEVINLQNYGCWCPKLLREKMSDALMGHPLDGLDRVCRDWWRCKRCASLAPYHCPIKKDYVYDVTHFNNAGAISCEGVQNDDCAYYNCLCDSEMALDIVANINMLNVTNIGVDPEDCVRPENIGGHVIDSCCVNEDFPDARPYSSDRFICVDGQVKDLTYL